MKNYEGRKKENRQMLMFEILKVQQNNDKQIYDGLGNNTNAVRMQLTLSLSFVLGIWLHTQLFVVIVFTAILLVNSKLTHSYATLVLITLLREYLNLIPISLKIQIIETAKKQRTHFSRRNERDLKQNVNGGKLNLNDQNRKHHANTNHQTC